MLQIPRIPVRIGVQADFDFQLTVPIDSSVLVNYAAGSVTSTWIEYQLQAYYDFKRISVGLGAYWKRRENEIIHLFPDLTNGKRSGIQMSASIPLNWIDIEFRTKIGLQPIFAALGTSQHSVLFLYNFDRKRISRKPNKKVMVNGLIGARFFLTKSIELLIAEDLVPIGTAPMVGLEIVHKKSGVSINIERDWWVAFNGGSFRRDTKGYINTAFLGAGYNYLLNNNRYFRIKIGGSFITDYDKLGKLKFTDPNVTKLITYQIKGIGASFSYELLPNIDVEIKHTFPIIGDKLFNPLRTSVGLIYRYNPNK